MDSHGNVNGYTTNEYAKLFDKVVILNCFDALQCRWCGIIVADASFNTIQEMEDWLDKHVHR